MHTKRAIPKGKVDVGTDFQTEGGGSKKRNSKDKMHAKKSHFEGEGRLSERRSDKLGWELKRPQEGKQKGTKFRPKEQS
ncbi:hypothetical protein TNCT_655581 [Trichonephila clavata]|uniref:Uncharacterized protein n=1 Tax=Trichonephila clavata TaxID=2740835 RepID=A0A8X6FIV9_TRICU|nr:hypothetical protein TNCT_655581 [Trichonephila clavata]